MLRVGPNHHNSTAGDNASTVQSSGDKTDSEDEMTDDDERQEMMVVVVWMDEESVVFLPARSAEAAGIKIYCQGRNCLFSSSWRPRTSIKYSGTCWCHTEADAWMMAAFRAKADMVTASFSRNDRWWRQPQQKHQPHSISILASYGFQWKQ